MDNAVTSPACFAGAGSGLPDPKVVLQHERKLVALAVASGLVLGVLAGVAANVIPDHETQQPAVSAALAPAKTVVTKRVSPPHKTALSHEAAVPSQVPAVVQRIDYDSAAGHMRVRVGLASMVRYQAHALHNPERIFVDLYGSRLGDTLPGRIAVGQAGLKAIRMAQYTSQVARIVLDLDRSQPYSVARMQTGQGLLIDLAP